EEYTLPNGASIGLVHPIELEAATLAAWKQQLEETMRSPRASTCSPAPSTVSQQSRCKPLPWRQTQTGGAIRTDPISSHFSADKQVQRCEGGDAHAVLNGAVPCLHIIHK